jgi:Putative zinc-finger
MKFMDHAEAVRTKAAERYLLGEMAATDREQYEEHFFECVDCAQELEAGAAFVDNAKEALASSGVRVAPLGPKVSLGGGWSWFIRPAFVVPAMAVLLLIAGYQTAYEVPQLKSELSQATVPQTMASLSLMSANSRGGAVPEGLMSANKPFVLLFDIPPAQKFSAYRCDVQSESGPVEFSVNVSAEEAKQTVQVLIPRSKLAAGKYVLVVRGYGSSEPANEVEVARFPFILNFSR